MATTKTAAPKATSTKPKAAPRKAAAPKAAETVAATPAPVAKARAAKAPVAKTTVQAPVASPVVASVRPVAEKAATLKLKDLLERVVKATGGKKKGVKAIVEATLTSLGEALTKGHDLNLPPLGKAKVSRQRDLEAGEIIMVKLRRGGAGGSGKKDAKEALAEAED